MKPPPINSEEKAGREIVLSRTDAEGKPLPGRMLNTGQHPGQQPMWPLLFARCAKQWTGKELQSIFLWMGFEPDTKPILTSSTSVYRKTSPIRSRCCESYGWPSLPWPRTRPGRGPGRAPEVNRRRAPGSPCTPEKAEDIFKEYDLDGSNLLEALEFADLCSKVSEPSTDTFKGPLVAEKEKAPWVPPDQVFLTLSSSARQVPPSVDEVGSDDGVDTILKLLAKAETPSERQIIFDVSCSQTEIWLPAAEQARKVFHAADLWAALYTPT